MTRTDAATIANPLIPARRPLSDPAHDPHPKRQPRPDVADEELEFCLDTPAGIHAVTLDVFDPTWEPPEPASWAAPASGGAWAFGRLVLHVGATAIDVTANDAMVEAAEAWYGEPPTRAELRREALADARGEL
jgi:hypothetical protein